MSVDLSLIKLPANALIFPDPEALISGRFTLPRSPVSVTKIFDRKAARIGFLNLRFHDLRGTHETLLLDRGVPVHVVAARCGHDQEAYAALTRRNRFVKAVPAPDINTFR